MTDFDRIARYYGAGVLEQLATKKVAVIGLGSGGGFVAVSLAMSGVGQFVLIDSDVIERHNVVRHVADLDVVGLPKVDAVADLIRARNREVKVTTLRGRFEDHVSALNDVDLVVVGVDGERPKYAINQKCRELGVTAVYAGVYERGEGGDVAVIHPSGAGPCYACWAVSLREELIDQGVGDTALDYGMIGADGTLEAEPGLWLHVVRVASVQAELALNELLKDTPAHREYPANTVIIANVEMEILAGKRVPPYSSQWVDIPRDPQCMVCGGSHLTDTLSLDKLLSDQQDVTHL
jgi:molybdopterin/thiamine biosynthesis adenylyltransferase